MEASKFATPSLRFSKLNRSNIDIIYDAKISPGTTLRLQAVEGIPAAPFRIFNASNLKSLVLRSDQGTPASLINTVRFGVKLTSDDVRANASFHDCWNVRSLSTPGSQGPASIVSIQSATYSTIKDHPYSLQVQPSTGIAEAASTGSNLASFVLLDVPSRDGFYLFNPSTNTFLATGAVLSASADTSVLAETSQGFRDSESDRTRFIWKFFLDEQNPLPRAYRIVHSTIASSEDLSAVDSTAAGSSTAAVRVSARDQRQIWMFSATLQNRRAYGGTTSYDISTLAKAGAQSLWGSTSSWRVFALPPPSRGGEQCYLICNEADGTFLSLERTSGKILLSNTWSLDDIVSQASSDLTCILWKLLPSEPVLADGRYQCIWSAASDSCLSRGNHPGAMSTPVVVSRNASDGLQWWNITAQISRKGDIFHTIRNYLSAETLDMAGEKPVLVDPDGVVQAHFMLRSVGDTISIAPEDCSGQVLGVDGSRNLILRPQDLPAQWKLVSGVPEAQVRAPPIPLPTRLTLDTWGSASSHLEQLPLIADGIYRIINQSTARVLSLGPGTFVTLIADMVSDSTCSEWWHISKAPGLAKGIYRIRNYIDGAILSEEPANALADAAGARLRVRYELMNTSDQYWSILPESRFSYLVQSCQTAEALLDDQATLSDGTCRVTPKIDAPSITQKWLFYPVPSPVPSGIYHLRFATGDLLTASLIRASSDRSPASIFSSWRVAVQNDAFCTLEVMTSLGLLFLAADASDSVFLSRTRREDSSWKFVSIGNESSGFNLVHSLTGHALTLGTLRPVRVVDARGDAIKNLNIGATCVPRFTGNDKQYLVLDAPPDSVPSLLSSEMVPSSQIKDGTYAIRTSRNTHLLLHNAVSALPPKLPRSRPYVSGGSTTPDVSDQWSIEATGNGYYTLSCNGLYMCQASTIVEQELWPYAPIYPSAGAGFAPSGDQWSPNDIVGSSPLYNAARWKVCTVDGKTYSLVNKATGSHLQYDDAGSTISAQSALSAPALRTFYLEPLNDTVTSILPQLGPKFDSLTAEITPSPATPISRELELDSGVFIFKIDSIGSVEGCLTLPEQDVLNSLPSDGQVQKVVPKIKRVDLDAYSLDAGLQMWTLLRDDDGWYTIENYLYQLQLAAEFNTWNGRRIYPKDPPAVRLLGVARNSPVDVPTTQWKLLQADERICIVNRTCDGFCLVQNNDSLALASLATSPKYCWRIDRKFETNEGLYLAEGVHSLSVGAGRSTFGVSVTQVGLNAIGASGSPASTDGASFLTYTPLTSPKVAPLDTSSIGSLLWYITRVGDANSYTIHTFPSDVCLVARGSSLQYCPPQLGKDFTWQFVPLGSRYLIVTQSPTGQRFCMGAVRNGSGEVALQLFKPDEVKADQGVHLSYLWEFTREGVYVQGTTPDSVFASLAVLDNNYVINTTFKPIEAFKQTIDSHRMIWHMIPQSSQTVRIVSERAKLPLSSDTYDFRCSSDLNSSVTLSRAENNGYRLLFDLQPPMVVVSSEIATDMGGKSLIVVPQNPRQARSFFDPSTNKFTLETDLINSGKYSTWNFVPVTSVVGGRLDMLPRCSFAGGQLTTVNSVDQLRPLVQTDAITRGFKETWVTPYRPGVPAHRFRLLKYGSIFIGISDQSRRVIAAPRPVFTVDLAEVKDSTHWLQVSNNKIVALSDGVQKYWQIITNIKDVAQRLKPWYIVVGRSSDSYPIVLSVKNGLVVAAPYDVFDPDQLWRYYDWGSSIKSRVIFHVGSGKALQTDLTLVTADITGASFQTYDSGVARAITWAVDVDFTLKLQIAGLARHMYLSPSVLTTDGSPTRHLDMQSQVSTDGSVQYRPALMQNPPQDAYIDMQLRRGCRFVAAPTLFDISTKATAIENLVAANAPVFLHHTQTYLPIDVAEYLTSASLSSLSGEVASQITDDVLTDPVKKNWVLNWIALPPEQMPKPVVYVRVCRSKDVMMTGFTDIEYSLFYPAMRNQQGVVLNGSGWLKVTLRVDNETNTLDAVLFNDLKRIGNTNTNFTNLINPANNPLAFRLTPDGISRLHIFISKNPLSPLQPSCPVAETTDSTSWADWKTADNKPGALDSSTCYQILEADMVQRDDTRDAPVLPAWARYQGMWSSGVTNKYGPLYTPPTTWSPQTNQANLLAIQKDVAEAQAAIANSVATAAAQKQSTSTSNPQLDSVILDRTGWTVAADAYEPSYEPQNVLDGNTQTIWHTQYTPTASSLPHAISVDVQRLQILKGLKYLPRQDGSSNGSIGQFVIDLSRDGKEWLPTVATGSWANDNTEKLASFEPTLARFVRLTALTEVQGQGFPWTSCSEINLLVDPDPVKRLVALQIQSAQHAAEQAAAQAAELSSRLAAESKSQIADRIGVIDCATYGPRDVTTIVRDAYNLYLERNPGTVEPFNILISNDNMGGDSQPYVVKYACVLFRSYARGASPTDVVQAQVVRGYEGQILTLDLHLPAAGVTTADDQAKTRLSAFAAASSRAVQMRIEMAMYGPGDLTQLLTSQFQQQGSKLPWTVTVENGILGGDTWPNHVKTLNVMYRIWREGNPLETMVYKAASVVEGGTLVFQ